MIHIVLHFVVPLAVALLVYRQDWRTAALVMVGTMLVDLDHLLANPIYDPGRCSIGFHPLHTAVPIVIYGLLFLAPWIASRLGSNPEVASRARFVHWVGLGLLIHMALDWTDCMW